MAVLSSKRHYLRELDLLEHMKEEVAALGGPAPKELADHVRGMKVVLEQTYSLLPDTYKKVYELAQAEALDFIGRF